MTRSSANDDGFEPTQGPESSIGAGGTPDDEAEQVVRTVRISPARVTGSAMEELFAARKRVSGPGGIPGLYGAVLHVCGWFVLWQEGPEAAVQAALKGAGRRRRHDTPRLLHRSTGPRTLVETLSLSTTQWSERPEAFVQRIEALAEAGPAMHPRDVWRTFSEPCTLSPPGQWPPTHRRIGMVASDDPRSMEMARKLAERLRRPLVYRRFAGADPATTDVGAAYLDLHLRQSVLRLHAVSRRALGHPLVHEAVRGADRVALLVGDQPLKAMELAAGVSTFLRRTQRRPRIELLGQSAEVAASVRAFVLEHSNAPVTWADGPVTEARLLEVLAGEDEPVA